MSSDYDLWYEPKKKVSVQRSDENKWIKVKRFLWKFLYLNLIEQTVKKIELVTPTVIQRVAGSSPAGGAEPDTNY